MITPSRFTAASDPSTPAADLVELASDDALAPLVAANPNTPQDTLFMLGERYPAEFLANPVLPLLLLANPALPQEMMRRSLLWVQLIQQPNVPPAWLALARTMRDAIVRDALLDHIAIKGEAGKGWRALAESRLLKRAYHMQPTGKARDNDRGIERDFAAVPDLPEWYLHSLARHNSPVIRACVMAHPETPGSIVNRLSQKGYHAAIRQPDLTEDITTALATYSPLKKAAHALARHPALAEALRGNPPPDVLRRALRKTKKAERKVLAADPHTPVDVLRLLSEESDLWGALACNHAASPDLVERLSDTPDALVALVLSTHPAMTATIFARLRPTEGITPVVGLALCKHPFCTQEQRTHLLGALLARCVPFMDWLRRTSLLASRLMPASLLEGAASSPDWLERYIIARHPHTPRTVLDHMGACDANGLVRAAAQARLRGDTA